MEGLVESSAQSPFKQSIGSTMSDTNKSDLAVYTFNTGIKKQIMVIVDAKHTLNVHAIAQAIGAFSITTSPPIVAVMTH